MAQTSLLLDFDHLSLRFVQTKTTCYRIWITKAISVLLPSDVDATDPDSLGPFIARILSDQKIRTRSVIASLPRDQVILQKVPLPPTPEIDLATSVYYQVSRELPFPLETAVIDFTVTRRTARGLAIEAVAAAVKRETLTRLQQTCQQAGLNLVKVGLRPYANLVAVQHGQKIEDGSRTLFVEIGPELTEIDVFRGPCLDFSRSASVNVPIIPDDEVQAMEQGGPLPEYLRPTLQEVLLAVSHSVQAYRMSEPESPFTRCVIAGGTGLEPALAAALKDHGYGEVELFDPAENFHLPKEHGPPLRAFATPLGLAAGSRRPNLFPLDFLHPKRPDDIRRLRRRWRNVLSVAASLAFLVLIGWPVYLRVALNLENDAYEQNVVVPKEKEAREVAQFKASLDKLVAWRKQEYSWLDELKRIFSVLPDNRDLYLTGITASDTGEISLTGRIRDRSMYYHLVNEITQGDLVVVKTGDVKEILETGKNKNNAFVYRFDMKLEIKTKLDPALVKAGKQSYALFVPTPATPSEPEIDKILLTGQAYSPPALLAPPGIGVFHPLTPPTPRTGPRPVAAVNPPSNAPADVAGARWRYYQPDQAEEMIEAMLKADVQMTRDQAVKRVKTKDFDMARRRGKLRG